VKSSVFLLVLLLVITSCSTGTRERFQPRPDEPPAHLETLPKTAPQKYDDPFLRSLLRQPDEKVSIIIPVPQVKQAEPPVYDSLQVYAVQIRALADEAAANSLVQVLQQNRPDSAFVQTESGLHKVRVGPFATRAEADKERTYLRQNGYPGAWTTPHWLVLRKDITGPPEKPASIQAGQPEFYIQIASSGTSDNAKAFIDRNGNVADLVPKMLAHSGRIKLVLGPWPSRAEAERKLEFVRQDFPDAWIWQKHE
jgi:cell division septation protein DedD